MKLLFPDQLRARLSQRYAAQHRQWLSGGGAWPLGIGVGTPTEREAAAEPARVRAWVDAWSRWDGPGTVSWEWTSWPRLGKQHLPVRVELGAPIDVARAVDEERRFARAQARHSACVALWPSLASGDELGRHFDVLADYDDADYARLLRLVSWLLEHPDSHCFPRQLPVEGLDTKWLDGRRALVVDFLEAARGQPHERGRDFFAACGLRALPHRIRMRVLCSTLRRTVGGLTDIEVPLEELASLSLSPARAMIVENLETGLALPELPGCIAFMRLGNAVTALAGVPWLTGVPILYWGDLDTHGFAILARARESLVDVTSVLMDEATLLAHRQLWGHEPQPYQGTDLAHLSVGERRVFEQLQENAWGHQLRLEQERIPWAAALTALRDAVSRSEEW